MSKLVVLLAGAMFLVGVGLSVHAQTVVQVQHPRIHKALAELQMVRTRLAKGPPRFAGHRTQAIRNIDLAMIELQRALQVPTRP
jgi:hypothetical protein